MRISFDFRAHQVGEMDCVRDVGMFLENGFDGIRIGNIERNKLRAGQFGFDRGVLVQFPDHDGNPPLQQVANDAPADESSSAGYEEFHRAMIGKAIWFVNLNSIHKLPSPMQKHFEDYELNASRESTGRTITEADIILHAGQTGDFYPHHMDAEWCKTQPFKQRIAHGTLIFSVAVGMTVGEINPLAFSYGYDRLRFIKPVFIGDTIRSRVTIKDKRSHKKPEHGVVVEVLEVFNQRGETVLACEHLLLVERRSV